MQPNRQRLVPPMCLWNEVSAVGICLDFAYCWMAVENAEGLWCMGILEVLCYHIITLPSGNDDPAPKLLVINRSINDMTMFDSIHPKPFHTLGYIGGTQSLL